MCLTCFYEIPICRDKEKIINQLKFPCYLKTYKNEEILLNEEQKQEIINNALALVSTGVDCQITIWSIQWDNNYKPVNFN